jgi:MFS family permease
MTGYMPLLLSALWVTASFPGNVFTGLFVDKFGRRAFLLVGHAGILVTNIFETALQAQFLGTDNLAGQRAAIFFIFLFIAFWSSCLDASQFLYLSEIFPTHIRAQGMAVGMAGMYLASIILLVAGPTALDQIGWKFFLVLICPQFVFFLILYFFAPETKQRSLEDINAAFGETVAVHWFHATEAEEEEFERALQGDVVHETRGMRQAAQDKAGKAEVQMVEQAHSPSGSDREKL